MKRNIIIFILFVMSCIFDVGASNTQFTYTPSALTINNEGGKFTVTIKQEPQTENETCYIYRIGGNINVQDSGGYMTDYCIDSPNKMVFTMRPRDTADHISGTITVICSLTRTDALEPRPIIRPIDSQIPVGGNENGTDNNYYECVSYTFSISYDYFALWGLFGGVIEEDDTWYEHGVSPKRIDSVSPAVCGQTGEIVYTWEKKVGNGAWEEIENSNCDSYAPETMGYHTVLYRRKATCGNYTEYSNTVEKRAVLNAGEIGIVYTDTSSILNLTDKRSPSVAVSQLFWESSEDMDSWTKISSGRLTMQVNKPAVTTYYRRAATSLDGETVRYSNIVCYNLGEPVYISKKTSTNKLGHSYIEDIMYYDGLGRPMQSVAVNAAASDADLITAFTYDNNGRQAYDHLPISITGNGGSFVRNIEYKADAYYKSLYNKSTSVYPYAQNEYDGSPLSRIVKTYRQGAEYQADSCRFVSYSYALNDADEVRKLSVNDNDILSVGGFYPKNELYKNTVADEDGNSKITFTDAYGNMVLSRQWTQANGNIDTYYVYDKCNRLRWVISPEGSVQLVQNSLYTIDSDFAKKYCYRYAYGSNGKICEKHLPGQDSSERMSYDEFGRVDSLFTANSERVSYSYTYDNLGRLSRICANVSNGQLLLTRANFIGEPHLTAGTFDISEYKYDGYDYTGDFVDHEFVAATGVVADNDKYDNVCGQKTQEKIYEAFSLTGIRREYLCRTYYYDIRNRIIQTVETDYRGNKLRTSYQYDYIGNILARYEQYNFVSEVTDVRYDYTYDSRGRITAENVSIDGQPQTSVANVYDTLGRLKSVMFGDKIKTQYSYNIQGWLTKKDIDRKVELTVLPLATELAAMDTFDDLFDEQLRYFDPIDAQPLYSGNVSEMDWSRSGDRGLRYCYTYTYDELGRLTNSDFDMRNGMSTSRKIYGERNISYDRNGNIIHFDRGVGTSTLYKYDRTFSGNRLISSNMQTETKELTLDGMTTEISDPVSTAFGYDSMGNITTISNDDLEIDYNFLNLPRKIVRSKTERDRFGQMKLLKETTQYRYLSDGKKVSSCDADGNGYMYFGTARFTLDNNVPTFESIPFSGGRIVKTSNGYEPQYYLTDHLGSTRMIVNKDGKTVEATFDYTPFGVQIVNSQMPTNSTEYRFSGKELQNISDYEIYDFGARQYFPKYAIWGSVDPLAGSFANVSPFAYCSNNPVLFVDPDGERAKVSIDAKNQRVVISANIYINSNKYSDRELRSIANKIHSDIVNKWDKNWTYTDGNKKYSVKFNVRVIPGTEKRENTVYDNFVTISDTDKSFVKPDMINGEWNINHKGIPAHEFGHLLGLTDHYIEGKDEFGRRKTPPEEGWEGNIMASGNGEVEQRNIDDILYKIFTKRRNKSWIEKLFDNKDNYLINEVKK